VRARERACVSPTAVRGDLGPRNVVSAAPPADSLRIISISYAAAGPPRRRGTAVTDSVASTVVVVAAQPFIAPSPDVVYRARPPSVANGLQRKSPSTFRSVLFRRRRRRRRGALIIVVVIIYYCCCC